MFEPNEEPAVPSFSVSLEEERDPPPSPTKIQFPDYDRLNSVNSNGEMNCDLLYDLLARARKPQHITDEYLTAFNIKVESDIDAPKIVPDHDLKCKPPYRWPVLGSVDGGELDATGSAITSMFMSNGAPFPDKSKYELLKSELLFDNDDAFRSLARLEPPPGRKNPRIAHARKFWTALQQAAQYWDSSHDNYYEIGVEDTTAANGHGKGEGLGESQGKGMDTDALESKMDIDSGDGHSQPPTTIPNVKPKSPSGNRRYKGRRIGAGTDMPDSVREDILRGLVEMVAWSLGCQVKLPTMPPRLAVKDLLFPVRQSFTVSRIPQDRQEARKHILEGPVLVGQCRAETHFYDDATGQRYVEKCDVLRETAGMLLLAQERARENQVETKPGDGKWWTSTPRWGGLPNHGPVGEPIPTGPERQQIEPGQSNSPVDGEATSSKRTKHDRSSLSFRRGAGPNNRRISMIERWRSVQPGQGLWDKRMRYIKIGANADSPFDDVFMVSSINHHFSIIHLRVYDEYLQWLSTGKVDTANSGDDPASPWATPSPSSNTLVRLFQSHGSCRRILMGSGPL
ncbi:hypothetical protein MGYG_00859 [Nannizzia gypsea CBS 118893]|uniref:Uncharacterized protein n=1 Tax=Arthroderma gypseum (strain ATCC MYA-4604 / CBS 118893) TaxID=535722 RepID=E5R2E7_ARTGP|nr:hypothetical protein MGYG_00859 [Nannizzia gypsea CBS 118893]EFQ97823.1 hypothetical protein MGYG_00859 [Nannizzia gypsea CBS 118893]